MAEAVAGRQPTCLSVAVPCTAVGPLARCEPAPAHTRGPPSHSRGGTGLLPHATLVLPALVSAGNESACTPFYPRRGCAPRRAGRCTSTSALQAQTSLGLVANPLLAAAGRGCSLRRSEVGVCNRGCDARPGGAFSRLPLTRFSGDGTNTLARTEKLEARRASRY